MNHRFPGSFGRYWDTIDPPDSITSLDIRSETSVFVDAFVTDIIISSCYVGETVTFPVETTAEYLTGPQGSSSVLSLLPVPVDFVGVEEPDWPTPIDMITIIRGRAHVIYEITEPRAVGAELVATRRKDMRWPGGSIIGFVLILRPAATWGEAWNESRWRAQIEWSES